MDKELEEKLIIKDNIIKYEDNISAYNEYLNYVAYLVKVLAYPDNVMSAIVITNKLIRDGVFSRNKEFKYVYTINNNIEGFLGLNVVNGYGNSRNICAFISDVLSKLGFKCSMVFANVTDKEERDNNIQANQTLNIFQYDGNIYGYDVMNNAFYVIDDNNKMNEIYSNNPLYAHLIQELKVNSNGKIISEKDFKYIMDYTNRQIDKNTSLLFNDCVAFSKQYIDRITDGISTNKVKVKK